MVFNLALSSSRKHFLFRWGCREASMTSRTSRQYDVKILICQFDSYVKEWMCRYVFAMGYTDYDVPGVYFVLCYLLFSVRLFVYLFVFGHTVGWIKLNQDILLSLYMCIFNFKLFSLLIFSFTIAVRPFHILVLHS